VTEESAFIVILNDIEGYRGGKVIKLMALYNAKFENECPQNEANYT
jgi:hypothetical protein